MRDYGTATWEGGDAACDHVQTANLKRDTSGGVGGGRDKGTRGEQPHSTSSAIGYRDLCGKCGARRIDQQIGLESSPEEFVAKLVEVFREVRRVLREDGTCWIVIGDSYAADRPGGQPAPTNTGNRAGYLASDRQGVMRVPDGLKKKDLIGIPWMVAFALRADGWWLRSEIIWHKRAPMPESVTDRPTKAHEQVFLLSKAATYYYDHIAIAEPLTTPIHKPGNNFHPDQVSGPNDRGGHSQWEDTKERSWGNEAGRNRRSVWSLGPESFAGAHFAVMPQKLVEPCILAGTSAYGCCSACGAPWERVVERESVARNELPPEHHDYRPGYYTRKANGVNDYANGGGQRLSFVETLGWVATCTCNAAVTACTVLDCFNGAATVGVVAMKHHRNYIGIDLNAEYLKLSEDRLGRVQPMLLSVTP